MRRRSRRCEARSGSGGGRGVVRRASCVRRPQVRHHTGTFRTARDGARREATRSRPRAGVAFGGPTRERRDAIDRRRARPVTTRHDGPFLRSVTTGGASVKSRRPRHARARPLRAPSLAVLPLRPRSRCEVGRSPRTRRDRYGLSFRVVVATETDLGTSVKSSIASSHSCSAAYAAPRHWHASVYLARRGVVFVLTR